VSDSFDVNNNPRAYNPMSPPTSGSYAVNFDPNQPLAMNPNAVKTRVPPTRIMVVPSGANNNLNLKNPANPASVNTNNNNNNNNPPIRKAIPVQNANSSNMGASEAKGLPTKRGSDDSSIKRAIY
jgi:hypothetical protein